MQAKGLSVIGIFCLAACAGDQGLPGMTGPQGGSGEDGQSSLVNVSAEPAGASCANGGQRIEVGVDDDGDGTLDAAEVDSTTFVCNGGSGGAGASSLIRLNTEPAGTNCPEGGQRIDTGVDDDGDGTLDPGEVDSTSYVCTGADGVKSLVTVTPEPEGANCASGGQRIDVGIDDDGDSVLDAAEIDQTAYVCDGAPSDSVVPVTPPDPATVFNNPEQCYFYSNNLMSGLWHRNSNKIIVGHYSSNGYWSHPAGAGGYTSAPNIDTGVKYARMVHMPNTATVIHAGADQFPSAASTVFVGRIDRFTGALSGFAPAVWGDGFTGNCNLISSTQSQFLCWDGTVIRRYNTTEGSATLTPAGTVTLSQAPVGACGSFCFGGTFAWDGTYFYFGSGNSSSSRAYDVYNATGTFVATHTATGNGAIDSVYFDWSAGAYATHDGFGGRSGTANYLWSGGSQTDDSQCYRRSTVHTLP
jgi:hypothetical protein